MRLAILGAGGGLGRNALDAALAAGHEVVALVRRGSRALPPAVRVVEGDATRTEDVARALDGADAALFCVNPKFAAWITAFPPLVTAAIDAARRTGARLVFPANTWIYGKGRAGELVGEDHPAAPISARGKLRTALEQQIRDSGARFAMLRLPEYYGPHVVTLTARVVRAALDGRRAGWPGPLGLPIELVFMPDAGRALVALAGAADVDGATFHLPGARTTARGFIAAVFAAVGRPPRAWSAPGWLLRLGGVFDATIRGAADVKHLWTDPILLDGARYAARFGSPPVTPLADGVAATVAWHREVGAVVLQG